MVSHYKQGSKYVIPLCECTKDSLDKVGGKNANLGEMINQGFSVPDGFAVTVNAYEKALEGIKDKICKELEDLCSTDMDAVDHSCKHIRELIRSEGMPEDIKENICHYYLELSKQYHMDNFPVAVRSSATAEDLPGASFAGQQDTYLWVTGIDKLMNAIVDCWASLFTSRAVCYRIKQCFDHKKAMLSVCVQQMVNPKTAGVMFTINPLNGDRSKIMIGGSWGLGESVVSGSVNPDEWMVDKVLLEIIRRTVVPKMEMHEVDLRKKEVVVKGVPAEKQDIPCLSDEEIIELSKTGKALERHYGTPQDIEWAIAKDLSFPQNIFILQTRPETVWSRQKPRSVLGDGGTPAGQISSYLTKIKA